jgi:hypothetical protein
MFFPSYYKYHIGEVVTIVTDKYEAARWNYYEPITLTGKIIGVENYFINATPVYRVRLTNGKVQSFNQDEIIKKASTP